MFEYEWGNPSSVLFPPPTADPVDDGHQHRHTAEGAYSHVDAIDIPTFLPPAFLPLHHHSNNHFHAFPTAADPRGFPSASYSPAPSSDDFDSPAAFFALPKPGPDPPGCGSSADLDRIGLNLGLGGRTYFSAADEGGFLSRLYRRSRPFDRGLGGSLAADSPKCQVEGCNADLSNAKHYHRRHKVCEFHSKSSTVVAGGLTQRFCQQCSRFHLLTEFDNGKRSCRRRLADHNRRRRKSNRTDNAGNSPSCSENPPRSPSESRAHSVSSATAAVSPPMEECKLTCYNSSEASPSVSSNSLFY